MTSGILAALIVSAVALNGAGRGARVIDRSERISNPSVKMVTVQKTTEIYALLKERGMRGRVLVHAGKYLLFTEVEESLSRRVESLPVHFQESLRESEKGLSPRNVLWMAMRANMVRKVFYVMSDSAFQERLSKLDGTARDISVGRDSIVTHYKGSERVVSNRFPGIREPVILTIDASFMDAPDVRHIAESMQRSGLSVDLMLFCRAEDNPDVDDTERTRLDELRLVLSGLR